MTVNRDLTLYLEARSTWSFLGCYTDNVYGRALPHGEAIPGGANAMTNELCQSTCLQAGFLIAGTEYAGECWCGNAVVNGGGPAPDGDVGCNMKCKGAYAETCGGPNRLSVYQYGSSVSSATIQATPTPGSTGDAEFANFFEGYEKVIWAYDWGDPSHGLDSLFEFPFSKSVNIGMPKVLWNNAGSSSGGNYDSAIWTHYFVGNCTACHFDFIAIHYYQDCDPADGQSGAEWFQANVTNAYETFKLPVWITEFQCYGNDVQQVSFLQKVLPWMDSQSYVERYAYFGAFPNILINGGRNRSF
ncbi:glycoside hydrolase family 128 protein [Stipitochalara longipes BDJ]|nr:glycoside hydrolase family 128 protein [Stipitochalara longipes BDJ]